MSEPTDTERAMALAARDGLTTDGFNGSVCIACGQDTPNHDEDCPLMAVLAAVRAEGERAGLEERGTLAAGVLAVRALINESRAVAGLHRNGDEAPWDDLRRGGRYEEWLIQFDDALDVAEAIEREAGKA